ncbi:hypothetical protein CASFOL_002836 [Castilleja foliolosa]|uniref:DCD domain-containing protein n=1 Tax=Castilleja foliolosa TaxID=1961234 RepID=A0ABD3EJ47_9LAMI
MMVGTGGEEKTDCSNKAVEAFEVAENTLAEAQTSHSLAVNVDTPNDNDESEDEVVIPVERAGDDGYEEMPDRVESENTARVDYDGEHMLVTETNCDNKAEWEQNITEDDEINGNIFPVWEEEGDVENIAHEDEANEDDDDAYEVGFIANEDEASEDNDDEYEVNEGDENISHEDEASVDDDDVYEVGFIANEDEASEDDDDEYEVGAKEDDDDEDEDNAEEATEVARGNEMEVKAKEDGTEAKAKEDGAEARAKEDVTEARAKEVGTEAKAKEDGTEAKKHDADKVEAGLKNGKTANKRIRKKRGSVGRRKKLESGDKPESSLNKKGKKKRVESMGMIFMCSSKTKDDCFQYKILGLPESKKDIVEKIYDGMRLFLYDLNLKLLYGIYKAAGPGGYNIEPKAFKSKFPSQVRFTVLNDCLPLPEEKFKKVIKENYFTKNKFDCQLKPEQVKKLCKLFVESSKGHLSKKSRHPRKLEKPQSVRQEVSKRRRVVDDKPQESRYRERPRKRPRHQPLPAPLPSTAPLYSYERPSDRRDHQYNPYRDRGNPRPVTRHDPYPMRDSLPYRDVWDTYPRRPVSELDGRISYFERRDPYVDGRGLYLERRDLYSEPYGVSSYRRDPLLDRRGAYREDARAYDFETRYRSDIGSRDLYVLGREQPLYVDPIYPGEYPSRGRGLARDYRL